MDGSIWENGIVNVCVLEIHHFVLPFPITYQAKSQKETTTQYLCQWHPLVSIYLVIFRSSVYWRLLRRCASTFEDISSCLYRQKFWWLFWVHFRIKNFFSLSTDNTASWSPTAKSLIYLTNDTREKITWREDNLKHCLKEPAMLEAEHPREHNFLHTTRVWAIEEFHTWCNIDQHCTYYGRTQTTL